MIRSLVAIAMMLLFAKAASTSTFAAMIMYWWYALFRPHDWMWWDISAYRIPLVAAGVFVLFSLLSKHWPKFNNSIHILIGLYAANTLASQLVTYCDSPTEIDYGHVLVLSLTVLLTASFLSSLKHILALVLAVCLFFSFHSATLGIEILVKGGTLYDIEVGSGTMTGSNAVALASSMTIFLSLPIVILLKNGSDQLLYPLFRMRTVRYLTLVVILYNILGLAGFVYGTDSRGSALALIAGGFFWIFLLRRRFTWLTVAVVAIVAVFSLNLVPQSYYDRLSSAFKDQSELDSSAASRPHFWGIAHKMAQDKTLGVGVGCYPKEYEFYDPTEGEFGVKRSVHSSYFNILAELGYSGVVIWALLQLAVMWTLWKVRYICGKGLPNTPVEQKNLLRILSNCLMASHVTFLLGGIFYEFTYNDISWLTFVIAAACGKLAREMVEENREEKEIFVSIYSPEHVRRSVKEQQRSG